LHKDVSYTVVHTYYLIQPNYLIRAKLRSIDAGLLIVRRLSFMNPFESKIRCIGYLYVAGPNRIRGEITCVFTSSILQLFKI